MVELSNWKKPETFEEVFDKTYSLVESKKTNLKERKWWNHHCTYWKQQFENNSKEQM